MDGITMVNTKYYALAKKLEGLDMKVVSNSNCKLCGRDHASYECQLGNHYALEALNE